MKRSISFSALSLVLLVALQATAQQTVTLSPGFSPDPQRLSGTAGGTTDASVHGSTPLGGCFGWIPATPQHVLTLTDHLEWLSARVSASGDTTLVVEGPVGWWCNDDDIGLNAGMSGQWAPGTYRLYVGTYDQGQALPYTLTLSSSDSPDVAAVDPPIIPDVETPPIVIDVPEVNPELLVVETPELPVVETPEMPVVEVPPIVEVPPVVDGSGLDTTSAVAVSGTLPLATGFLPDPQILEGTSGGSLNAASLDIGKATICQGWVSSTPNHLLTLSTEFNYLRVDVSSQGDTTLVVHGPNGWSCNDDTVGLSPRVEGPFTAGTYRIWVGSYDQGKAHAYRIAFTEWGP